MKYFLIYSNIEIKKKKKIEIIFNQPLVHLFPKFPKHNECVEFVDTIMKVIYQDNSLKVNITGLIEITEEDFNSFRS